jgi:hypothetical protein
MNKSNPVCVMDVWQDLYEDKDISEMNSTEFVISEKLVYTLAIRRRSYG